MTPVTLIYPSVPESESRMLDDVETIVNREKLEEPTRHNFLLAVSEAFTNALLHGNESDPSKDIVLCISITPEAVTADIIDQGLEGLASVRSRRPRGYRADGGRGIGLICYLAEEVQFATTEAGGLKVTLRFDRKRQRRETIHRTTDYGG